MTVEHITSDIDILPAQRPAQPAALAQLMAHAEAMTHAKQLADALCQTDLVPDIYKGKPGNGAAAILFGAELGLNPIQSLQNIFVLNGKPSMYARTAVALVKSQTGISVRTVDESDESVTVSATDPATGQVEISCWDLARADRAGYLKNSKYKSDPRAMLWAKAAMEVCRRIAPDVLLGMAFSREELELDRTPAPTRIVSSRRGVDGLRAAIVAPVVEPEIIGEEAEDDEEQEQPAAKAMAPATRAKWVNRLGDLLTEAELDEADGLDAIAEVLKCDRPESIATLTDDALRTVVNELNVMSKAGELAERIGDLLNIAALREAEVSA